MTKKQINTNTGNLSIGYPKMEKLLDTEDFEKFNEIFGHVYDELSVVAKKKRGLKKGRDATKAMKSIDLMIKLVEELLQLKYKISTWWAEKQKEKQR
ncbi:hypothetical protein KKA47_07420 [bacterium]|nr:hypothetical protein [bacterium]